MIITIDGPSGSGKGTIAQLLANQLGFHLLDSGALYRLTALAADSQGVSLEDEVALAELATSLDIEFNASSGEMRYLMAGSDVSEAIRQEHIGMGASKVGASKAVRQALLELQRSFAKPPGLVADGRDMGTTVFPQAELKVFLTASAEVRAERRCRQLESLGQEAPYDCILSDIKLRDKLDVERPVSPLKPADDAVLLDATELSIDEVQDAILALFAKF